MASKNKKSLGQHWLKNRAILDEIAALAAEGAVALTEVGGETQALILGPTGVGGGTQAPVSPVCLEIGPGLGTLTSSLLRRFARVVAVEFDEDLARKLPASFPGKALEVVNADILRFDLAKMGENYVVAGNIPYYITSPIIEKVLSAENPPRRVVLLVQKEVAERVASERETLLSLWVKNRAAVALGPVVKAAEFTPPPKVDSRVLCLTPHALRVSEAVLALIKRGFAAPRKKLTHNLASVAPIEVTRAALSDLGLGEDARPGELHLDDWARLAEKLGKI